MGFFRSFSSKDTWITNKTLNNNAATTATGSNHGASPSLSVFVQSPGLLTGTFDVARALLQFDLTELSGKIFDESVIPTGSISYVLRMFNLQHDEEVPSSYDLFVYPISQSWDEGTGIDDVNFLDGGVANWDQPTSVTQWTTTGSDFLISEYGSGSQHFDAGTEDLEMDVTDIVKNWLTSSNLPNNGLILKFSSSLEDGQSGDFYRKAFHSRESKFVDRIPYIEARWEEVLKDNRNNFAYDQDSTLYLYNFVRGELTNLQEPIFVRLQDHVNQVSASYVETFTASFVSTGIYSASFNIEHTASFSASWVDVWFSGSRAYMTGNFTPLELTGSQIDPYDEFVVDVVNLKSVYGVDEEARLIASVRKRDFVTHKGIVNSSSLDIEREYIESMYYSIENDDTGVVVVPFGTASSNAYTQLSYNGDGNYFEVNMKSLIPGFKYRLKFLIDINRFDKKVIDDNFTFRVV